jgi:hypothetical protein
MQLSHYYLKFEGEDSRGRKDPIKWTLKIKDAATREMIEEKHKSKFQGDGYYSMDDVPKRL